MRMRTNLYLLKAASLLVAIVLPLTSLKAALLSPNTFITPTLEAGPVNASLLATTNVSFSAIDAGNNVLFSGTLISSVWSGDTSNPYSGLTFTYQLSSAPGSLHTIDRLTLNSFSGLLTDVGYNGTGIVPIRAIRPGSDLIAFDFENVLFQPTLGPGLSSATLVIQTDSPYWNIGNGSVINGATANLSAFAPVAVPEPTSMALVGLGIAAFLLRRKP